jgi:hypothetical protein
MESTRKICEAQLWIGKGLFVSVGIFLLRPVDFCREAVASLRHFKQLVALLLIFLFASEEAALARVLPIFPGYRHRA